MSERVKANLKKVDGEEELEQRPAQRVLKPRYCRSYAKRRVAEALASLSVEQRIAVKSQLLRAGLVG